MDYQQTSRPTFGHHRSWMQPPALKDGIPLYQNIKKFENRKPISDLYHLQAYGLNSKMYRNKHNITDLLCLLLDALKILNDNLEIAENSKSTSTNNN